MKYQLDGFICEPSSKDIKWILSGILEPNNDGSFESKIMNAASNLPKQTIRGSFFYKKGLGLINLGLVNLVFIESSLGKYVMERKYSLERKDGLGFEGTYKGRWSAGPITDKAEINISRA